MVSPWVIFCSTLQLVQEAAAQKCPVLYASNRHSLMKLLQRLLRVPPWAIAVLSFFVLVPSLSRQSIDLEESQTWGYARLASAAEVIANLQADRKIEAQMPLGMLAAWGWSRLFGTTESGMRSINLLWLAVALSALVVVARETGIRWVPLLFAIQPFVWYSMDFARTALMEMAGGALLLAGTIKLLNGSSDWLKIALLLSLGSLILCGANISGVVLLAVVLMFLLGSAAWRNLLVPRGSKIFLFGTAAVLAILGVYYFSTILRGAGGAKLWAVTPFNLLVVAYEFMGFTGLGPGRQDFREILRGMAPPSELLVHLPGWLALALAYGLVTVAAVKSWLTRAECGPRAPSFRLWLFCAAVPGLSVFFIYCLSTAYGSPFWGRNLAGSLPFAVTALAVLLHWATQGLWRRVGRFGVAAVCLMLVVSAASVRLLPYHRHDNYRDAARVATSMATEDTVWWVADFAGGEYYGIPFVERGPGIIFAMNLAPLTAEAPDAIVISRPENFDAPGAAREAIQSGAYEKQAQFQAFEVWRRKEK